MSSRTVEYIRYTIPADGAEAFIAAYERAAEPLAASPQCVDYELRRCEEEPESFILRITWTSTSDHIETFRASAEFRTFFAEISPYVKDITEMRHYAPTGVAGQGAAVPSLYAWAGGAKNFDRLTEAFYTRVVEDDLLGGLFRELPAEHARHVGAWLAEVFGGPKTYSEQLGGHQHMAGKHLGKHITEAQRRRWVNLILDAADEVELPGDPEFRSAFVAYIEWGTRMALYYSNDVSDEDCPPVQPMPYWGWGVPGGPYQP
ncbi:antibiotic biosynthesis monooxygenase [Streptomyces sp. YC504]|uniref:Antibiotic biosynthesis monooxygenase n=1 Tax=Streptomyces mesophilus TaxID=1775132 RepID=A0A6G4XR82_9ACTN|nr:antibiotic biosynthesis monooxygenase [Streptomyces mesophilus]NGO79111.1 antibiotic biosynthesis monooxygenase [Streptomyces mesophilus]